MLPEWTATILLVFTKLYFDYRLRRNENKVIHSVVVDEATLDDIECNKLDEDHDGAVVDATLKPASK